MNENRDLAELDKLGRMAIPTWANEPFIKIYKTALLEYHIEPGGVLKMKFFPKESAERVGWVLRDNFGGARVEWVPEGRAFFVWMKGMDPFLIHGLLTTLEKAL